MSGRSTVWGAGAQPGWKAPAAHGEGPSSFVLSDLQLFKKGFGFDDGALLRITGSGTVVQLSKGLAQRRGAASLPQNKKERSARVIPLSAAEGPWHSPGKRNAMLLGARTRHPVPLRVRTGDSPSRTPRVSPGLHHSPLVPREPSPALRG